MASEDPRAALRRQLRAQRQQLGAAERMAAALALPGRLAGLAELARPGYVAGYWAMEGELSLHALLMARPAFIYCLPCLRDDRSLGFAPWRTGDPLQPNRYGIPEPVLEPGSQLQPEQLQVVLLPLLGFDRAGNRLGMGGGYYDRSFAFLNARPRPQGPLLVGIAHGFQEVPGLQAEAWDVPLDFVATEAELIDCRATRG